MLSLCLVWWWPGSRGDPPGLIPSVGIGPGSLELHRPRPPVSCVRAKGNNRSGPSQWPDSCSPLTLRPCLPCFLITPGTTLIPHVFRWAASTSTLMASAIHEFVFATCRLYFWTEYVDRWRSSSLWTKHNSRRSLEHDPRIRTFPPCADGKKNLYHAVAGRNVSMKEWFSLAPTAAVSGGTGVTAGTVRLSHGPSCRHALALSVGRKAWTFPEADGIPGKPPCGRTFNIWEKCPPPFFFLHVCRVKWADCWKMARIGLCHTVVNWKAAAERPPLMRFFERETRRSKVTIPSCFRGLEDTLRKLWFLTFQS